MEAIHEENHLRRIGPLLGDIGKRIKRAVNYQVRACAEGCAHAFIVD
jgi:hypothetical protein